MSAHVVISDAKSTTVDHDLQREVLEGYGATVSSTITRTEDAVIEEIARANGLIVDAGVPVTARVLKRASALEVVGRAGVGVDNVDLEAADRNDVTVVYNPTYCVDEVATHALGLLLAGVRKLPSFDRQTRDGGWDWSEGRPVHRLQDATIGFIAFGKIPRRLATMIQGFGCGMVAYDPYVPPNVVASYNVESLGFEEVLSRANLLTIHAPLTDETRGMLDADALAQTPEDVVIVNTARGSVVDTDALAAALEAGSIGFACVDVTDPEPLPEDHPLFAFENTLVTPHLAWYSEASREQLSREIADDVGRVLTGSEPTNPVTPETQWI